jgi:hypothetical protein
VIAILTTGPVQQEDGPPWREFQEQFGNSSRSHNFVEFVRGASKNERYRHFHDAAQHRNLATPFAQAVEKQLGVVPPKDADGDAAGGGSDSVGTSG